MIWQDPPAAVPLLTDEIHVWKASLQCQPKYVQLLSDDERQRANRFLFDKHRNRFIAGRAILRTIMGYYLHLEPQSVCFSYQANGKPELKIDGPTRPLHFNLAHTGELAVYAVTRDQEVGIDVEIVKPNPLTTQIAQRFFSPKEQSWLATQSPENQYRDFSRLWTLKEAYLKVSGRGLGAPLNAFTILPGQRTLGEHTIYEFTPEKGYVAALIGLGGPKKLIAYSFADHD